VVATAVLVAASAAPPAWSQVGEGTAEPTDALHLSEVLALVESRNPMLGALRSARPEPVKPDETVVGS
jgi:hypothetical protein